MGRKITLLDKDETVALLMSVICILCVLIIVLFIFILVNAEAILFYQPY